MSATLRSVINISKTFISIYFRISGVYRIIKKISVFEIESWYQFLNFIFQKIFKILDFHIYITLTSTSLIPSLISSIYLRLLIIKKN